MIASKILAPLGMTYRSLHHYTAFPRPAVPRPAIPPSRHPPSRRAPAPRRDIFHA